MRIRLALVGCSLVLAGAASAATPAGVEVQDAIQSDLSPSLRQMAVRTPSLPGPREQHVVPLRHIPPAPFRSPSAGISADVLQSQSLGTTRADVLLNFDGVGDGINGFKPDSAPPDTTGAPGDTQYVQWVNSSLAVFDKKTGDLELGPVPGKALWAGFGGGCEENNDGDVIVQYDKMAKRWVLSQFSISTGPYLECVAVSQTSDATGAYYRYAFSYGAVFNDYPKMGVWPDGYYVTYNMFVLDKNSVYQPRGARLCALDRASMLAGRPARQQCFQLNNKYQGVLPADLDGATPPPSGAPNYMLNLGSNSLNLWRFHTDWANPAKTKLSGPVALAVPAFKLACGGGEDTPCIPQPNTRNKLDALGDRLMYRLAYRVMLDSNDDPYETLVVNHSIEADGKIGVRWYELRNPAGPVTLHQSGTYAPGVLSRWMGSAAMDKAGDIAIGYSASGPTAPLFPSIRFAGRTQADPRGRLQGEVILWKGAGSQIRHLHRWGDYSGMTIDPVDDCTFWYTTEYLPSTGAFNWKTRIASFRFPNCQ